ncbi:hypothetical protein DFH06DRAFT_1195843 [Mycena polygramma]|nr:hypothetical protein DFH06DRAFT_1195843 [Mycena polygramma]
MDWVLNGQKIWNFYMHFLACCVIISQEHGYSSHLNFGAPIKMPHIEFVHRINQHAFYGSAQTLRRLMSHAVYFNAMEFLCARFVSTFTQRILVTERNDKAYISVWPLPMTSLSHCREDPAERVVRYHLHEHGRSLTDLDNAMMKVTADQHTRVPVFDVEAV